MVKNGAENGFPFRCAEGYQRLTGERNVYGDYDVIAIGCDGKREKTRAAWSLRSGCSGMRMTFSISLTEISVLIIVIAALILVAYAIPALIQLRRTGEALQVFSEDGKRFFADIKEITHKLNGQVSDMDDAVRRLRDVTLKATGVAEVVVDAIKEPVIKIAGVMAGLSAGLKHFRKAGK